MNLPAAMVRTAADLGNHAPMSNSSSSQLTRPLGPGDAGRRRSRPRVRATVSALMSALVVVGELGRVSRAATPPADAPPVSLVGDSTMAGMLWNSTSGDDPRDIVGNSYRLTFDAESCRRIVVASCRGRFGTVPTERAAADATTLKGQLGEAMVVMAGYDDASITNAVDQVVAEAEAQGVVRVMWLTYRTNTAYVLPGGLAAKTLYGSHNSELAAAAQRHSDLQILDWDKFTVNQPNWFAPTASTSHLMVRLAWPPSSRRRSMPNRPSAGAVRPRR